MTLRQRHVAGVDLLEGGSPSSQATIILLHGFGADATDLAPLSSLYPNANWIFPNGPIEIPFAPYRIGRAWFPVNIPLLTLAVRENRLNEVSQAFPPKLDEARRFIDDLILELQIPRSHLVIGGFSQGAILAIETALHGSEKMAGLLIFSGTLVNAINWQKMAPQHASTPFFQSHGIHDPLLPLKKARELTDLLIEGGLKGELHTFHGGHDIPPSVQTQLSRFLENGIFHQKN